MAPIIEIKNIGKEYQITHQRGGYVALRDVLAGIAKSPFKFFKQKAKQAAGLAKKEEFWALRGINFNVEKGEVIGIIGHNGAGKSTLLKILTGITPPAEGEIIMRGRIASLLEVGTGFHPELSGRENIFLNGAILGMRRKEIAEKFDQIVDFAGIEKFLDTPVKYYSSGMYVRLAFSVAAHLEPDILIVDEVLAVGDAEFQNKCLGKMDEITKKDGRTILFVSHNMDAVRRLCKKTIVLQSGKIAMSGDTVKAISFYESHSSAAASANLDESLAINGGEIVLKDFMIAGKKNQEKASLQSGDNLKLSFSISSPAKAQPLNICYSIRKSQGNQLVIFSHAKLEKADLYTKDGSMVNTEFLMPKLSPDEYAIDIQVWISDRLAIREKKIGAFIIPETAAFSSGTIFSSFPSIVMADSRWSVSDNAKK